MTPRRLLTALPLLIGAVAAAALTGRPRLAIGLALLAAGAATLLLDHLTRKDRP